MVRSPYMKPKQTLYHPLSRKFDHGSLGSHKAKDTPQRREQQQLVPCCSIKSAPAAQLCSTWTPKLCKTNACWAMFSGFGLLLYVDHMQAREAAGSGWHSHGNSAKAMDSRFDSKALGPPEWNGERHLNCRTASPSRRFVCGKVCKTLQSKSHNPQHAQVLKIQGLPWTRTPTASGLFPS